MSHLTIHTKETAPQDSLPTIEAIEQAWGFFPNLMAVFAESPAVLEHAFEAFGTLATKGTLTPVEQQLVGIAASRESDCRYCVTAHSALAVQAGIGEAILQEVRAGKPIQDRKLEILRQTTVALVAKHGWLSKDDLARFYEVGYTKAQLLEVIAWVANKTLTNFTNHIAETPIDEAFAPLAWEPATVV